jgi:hypothetical protein
MRFGLDAEQTQRLCLLDMEASVAISTRSLLATDNLVLDAYFGRPVAAKALESAYRRFDIGGDDEGTYTRLQAAVAAVLLRSVQHELPQWAAGGGGEVILSRTISRRKPGGFKPKHLFTLNWADTAPGFSWPMAYYATRVPKHEAVVVTASSDGPDTYGFADFAIGHFPAGQELLVGAKQVIVADWTRLAGDHQTR